MAKSKIRKVILALLLTVFLLAGCMDIDQQLWINSDGSGRMLLDVSTVEKNFQGLQKGEEVLAYLNKSLDKYQESLKQNTLITNLKTSQSSEGGVNHRVIEFDVTNFETYFEGVQKYDDPFTIRLETLDNGDFRFTEKLIPGGAEWLAYYYDYFGFRPGPAQLHTLVDGHSWKVRLYTPAIVSADGIIDPQTSSISWEVPLEEVYKLKESKNLTAIYQTQASTLSKPWFPIALGVVVFVGVFALGVLILGLILLLGYIRKEKKTTP